MAHLKVLPILFLLITFSFPAWAVRELVDDFNGATIDFTRWSNFDPAFSAGAY